MNEENDITFENTVDWANMKSVSKGSDTTGIPVFYLILGAFVIMVLLVLVFYLTEKKEEINELDMLINEDDDNHSDHQNDNEDDQNNENYDQSIEEIVEEIIDQTDRDI